MYQIEVSTRKNKKYDVYKNGKYFLSFGQLPYEHYFDKIGYYSHLNHQNIERKRLYYARMGKTTDKNSAKYWSNKYLW